MVCVEGTPPICDSANELVNASIIVDPVDCSSVTCESGSEAEASDEDESVCSGTCVSSVAG